MLPKNPYVLVSAINTYLRDKYSSLDELCEKEDEDKEEITNILKSIGYIYNSDTNQFIKE